MKHLNRFALIFCILPHFLHAEAPKTDEFLGVFTVENIPVNGCRVVRIGSMVSSGFVGHGRFGLDFGTGVLLDAANTVFDLDDRLQELAIDLGYNAVIGASIQISHAGDAVFETGQNWRIEGDRFDGAGSYVAIASGTPATIVCE